MQAKPSGKRLEIQRVNLVDWEWILYAANGKKVQSSEKPLDHRYRTIFEAVELYPGIPVFVRMPDDDGSFHEVDV